jgi:hypothetical protein
MYSRVFLAYYTYVGPHVATSDPCRAAGNISMQQMFGSYIWWPLLCITSHHWTSGKGNEHSLRAYSRSLGTTG